MGFSQYRIALLIRPRAAHLTDSRGITRRQCKRLKTCCTVDLETKRDQLLGVPKEGENPVHIPTYVKAPGRIVASECTLREFLTHTLTTSCAAESQQSTRSNACSFSASNGL